MIREIPNSFAKLNPLPETPRDHLLAKLEKSKAQFDRLEHQARALDREIHLAQKSEAATPGPSEQSSVESQIIGQDVQRKEASLKKLTQQMQTIVDEIEKINNDLKRV